MDWRQGHEARRAFLIGQVVRERRLALGLSQAEVAARAGMAQPTLSRLEAGGTVPTIPVLERLLRRLPQRSMALPNTFIGYDRMTGPLAIDTKQDWLDYVHQQLGAVGYSGVSYGTPRTAIMNVVAARTDLTGKLDLRMVADQDQEFGEVHCAQTLSFVTDDTRYPPSLQSNMLLCWRTTKALSVYVYALGVPPPDMGDLASAVESVWDGIPR